jgi:arabinogalactan endo-1,4-beta-galactosidase
MSCKEDEPVPVVEPPASFAMGVDLSYVNQIQDFGGKYKDNGVEKNPYQIFAERGATVARFRLFHNPAWTKTVYGTAGTQLYNDLGDVMAGIEIAKQQGMDVLLDFHYSDSWADPGKQVIPKAWENQPFAAVKDSIYNYTFSTLSKLNARGLLPEMVQIGNEINCGMVHPIGNVCSGVSWEKLTELLNSGIKAVRDIEKAEGKKIKVLIHVAEPEKVTQWFTSATNAGLNDFDVLGFSYYSHWSTIPLNRIALNVRNFKLVFKKEVMILETAYPWSLENADSYANIFGSSSLEAGYEPTVDGQRQYLIDLVQQVKDGGGTGVFYWEPAWISSRMKDLWGTGSSWENNALFDFSGNAHKGMDYMKFDYK